MKKRGKFIGALLAASALPMVAWGACQSNRPSCVSLGYISTQTECTGLNALKCPFGDAYYCGKRTGSYPENSAESVTCDNRDCAGSGYTMSSDQCTGRPMIKCPFGDAYYCGGAAVRSSNSECSVGDIIGSDNNCYVNSGGALPVGVTPVAVVFDTTNKLAITLEQSSLAWMTGVKLYPDDTTGNPINNYMNTANCDFTMHAEFNEHCAKTAPGAYFYVMNDLRKVLQRLADADLISRTWAIADLLPTPAESKSGCETDEIWIKFYTRGCNIKNVAEYAGWGQATQELELDSPIGSGSLEYYRTTKMKTGGYANTQAILAVSGKNIYGEGASETGTYTTPAAKYCDDKNPKPKIGMNPCSSTNTTFCYTEVSTHYFLPTPGDLIELNKNFNMVNNTIKAVHGTEMTSGNYWWTSTQSHTKGSYKLSPLNGSVTEYKTYDYLYAYQVRMGQGNANLAKEKRSDKAPVRCAYYYGDNWKVNGGPDNNDNLLAEISYGSQEVTVGDETVIIPTKP